MKTLLIILSILLFSGCTDHVYKAQQDVVCKEHGGVADYASFAGAYTKCYIGSCLANYTNIHT